MRQDSEIVERQDSRTARRQRTREKSRIAWQHDLRTNESSRVESGLAWSVLIWFGLALSGRVGRIGSDRIRTGPVGLDRVWSGRDGMGRVSSGLVRSGLVGSDRVVSCLDGTGRRGAECLVGRVLVLSRQLKWRDGAR